MERNTKYIWVRWRDSNIWNGQTNIKDEKFEVAEMMTIGHLIHKDKDKIVIAQDYICEKHGVEGDTGEYRQIIAIPRECIIGEIDLTPEGKG